jgi:hypothetical protein
MVRHSDTWIFNIRQHNWRACVEGPHDTDTHGVEHIGDPWTGVRSSSTPDIREGDLVLARRTTRGGDEPHGVLGVWRCTGYSPVRSSDAVPWTDGPYEWVIYCQAIQREFSAPYHEEFGRLPFDQRALQVSYRSFPESEASAYRRALCVHPHLSEAAESALGCQ